MVDSRLPGSTEPVSEGRGPAAAKDRFGGLDWRVIAHPNAALGEGICWNPRDGHAYMVDILGCRIIRVDIDHGTLHEWHVLEPVGWLIPVEGTDCDWLLGFQSGIARVVLPADGPARILTWLARPFPVGSTLRLNDAKADRNGVVWAGSLDAADESRPLGQLFRLAPDGELGVVDDGYCVANGPAIAPDGTWMLHTDSARRVIYRFDLDPQTSVISGKRVWKTFTEAQGYPDGMNFDSEGAVWVAHWGGGCVSRWNAGGELVAEFRLPVPYVTNAAFCGVDSNRLVVSTARSSASQPGGLDGAVFEIDANGASGSPAKAYLCGGVP